LEFVKRSGATVLGHDECVQSVLDLRLAVKAAVGIHVCKEVIFKLFQKPTQKKPLFVFNLAKSSPPP
jgi:hypothetical protein